MGTGMTPKQANKMNWKGIQETGGRDKTWKFHDRMTRLRVKFSPFIARVFANQGISNAT